MIITATSIIYKDIVKRILFLIDAETVHQWALKFGECLGRSKICRAFMSSIYSGTYPAISQSLFNIRFKSPAGLAAGFDYEASLTEILPSIGFGFGTVGTITRGAYSGNPSPLLGRLPRSHSLMVNKGFKNLGIKATLQKLKNRAVLYPVGISIGKTNSISIKTQDDAVRDVVASFDTAEQSGVNFAYYELNISCPNLAGCIEFYTSENLEQLLDFLSIKSYKHPIFIKMPISKTNEEIVSMMNVIVRYKFIKAVIIGNLQCNRNDTTLLIDEVSKFTKGNFSGKPCQARSNELIRLVYNKYGAMIKIIGCGGIFNAEDAYCKIKLGASLVQLMTGLIFEGPQLVAEINRGVAKLLKSDGYDIITQAIGVDAVERARYHN